MAQDVFGIVGTTLGGIFRVEQAVAEGGFSVVYRAHHAAFRAPVALKCLKVPGDLYGEQRGAYLEKFREEAELMFRLSASIPEIARPLHVGVLGGENEFVPFIALEWLDGEALDETIHKRRMQGQAPMSVYKLVKLLAPIASALARAHRFPGPNGRVAIVHCDIKPENILLARVDGNEVVKILDFGIATAMNAARRRARVVEERAPDPTAGFTPRTGAPEQWAPLEYGPTGPWTDVWGLAITMVEALLGEPPINGSFQSMHRLVMDANRRPTPRAHGVTVSDEVEAAFERALVVDPRQRTQDVETFWRELEHAIARAPGAARDRVEAPRSSDRGAAPALPKSNPIPRVDPDSEAPPPAPAATTAAAVPLASSVPLEPPAPLAAPLDRPSFDASSSETLAAPAEVAASRRELPAAPEPLEASLAFDLAVAPAAASPTQRQPSVATARSYRRGSLHPRRGASLRAPVRLLVLGVLVCAADAIGTTLTGGALQIASIRPMWLGGALVLVGAALYFWRLLGDA